ncbi:helix-turn-helix domain-containing protein [Arthrobacter sp. NIO-1057]|uniref:helix-turn-helix domain-containing protein n=1 Tax=Arthrobacter sp. NIO-1057 TaxID=993071 RepID=UPI000817D97F|nr:helix-turn-helix domain-containing protein [Arthrobacter sp. NIO-1057]SCC38102.1 Helix-turn-helix domain-containing protein [Arthrobacter sp. NIO-1057]
MTKKLDELLAKRPVNEQLASVSEVQLRAEIRAYRLRELREKSELTQTAMAKVIDVSQKRVSNIEHGAVERAQVDTLRRYIEALGERCSWKRNLATTPIGSLEVLSAIENERRRRRTFRVIRRRRSYCSV